MKFFQRVSLFFLDLFETVVIALAVFLIIYLFLFQPHQVRGDSMYPSFHNGEYILTDKISYRLKSPQRGDVVIFRAPQNEDYDYIKRIIGLPGENVTLESGRILVNDQIISEDYLPGTYDTRSGAFLRPGATVNVPVNHYFVLGDNRQHSSDSREWGFVPQENIVGRAWFRYWPTSRLGTIPEPVYLFASP